MKVYQIQKTSPDKLLFLKNEYLEDLIAPLDGMWVSFISMADHYAIVRGIDIIGYVVVNSDQVMLRNYVRRGHDQEDLFAQVIKELAIKGAVVATQEFNFLSLCLDNQKSVSINGLLYHCDPDTKIEIADFPEDTEFKVIKPQELKTAIDFAVTAIGAPQGWLQGYYSERIEGKELFGLWREDVLMAVGECRPSAEQPSYADLGMVVAADYRGQGLATAILREMLHDCRNKGLNPICSTEGTNVAARKAISNAGFESKRRLLDVSF